MHYQLIVSTHSVLGRWSLIYILASLEPPGKCFGILFWNNTLGTLFSFQGPGKRSCLTFQLPHTAEKCFFLWTNTPGKIFSCHGPWKYQISYHQLSPSGTWKGGDLIPQKVKSPAHPRGGAVDATDWYISSVSFENTDCRLALKVDLLSKVSLSPN